MSSNSSISSGVGGGGGGVDGGSGACALSLTLSHSLAVFRAARSLSLARSHTRFVATRRHSHTSDTTKPRTWHPSRSSKHIHNIHTRRCVVDARCWCAQSRRSFLRSLSGNNCPLPLRARWREIALVVEIFKNRQNESLASHIFTVGSRRRARVLYILYVLMWYRHSSVSAEFVSRGKLL